MRTKVQTEVKVTQSCCCDTLSQLFPTTWFILTTKPRHTQVGHNAPARQIVSSERWKLCKKQWSDICSDVVVDLNWGGWARAVAVITGHLKQSVTGLVWKLGLYKDFVCHCENEYSYHWSLICPKLDCEWLWFLSVHHVADSNKAAAPAFSFAGRHEVKVVWE